MSKIYDKKTVDHIQSCLNTGSVRIESYDSYENILPGMKIALGDVYVQYSKPTVPIRNVPGYAPVVFLGENATREYMSEWNKLPIKSHMSKDFRFLQTDKDGHIPYKTFTYTDPFGTEKRALVRHLFEIDDMDADQPECVEYYYAYTDLILNDACYMIVKIEDAGYDGYMSKHKLNIVNTVIGELPAVAPKTAKKDKSTPLF